jgi:hypothetical protein
VPKTITTCSSNSKTRNALSKPRENLEWGVELLTSTRYGHIFAASRNPDFLSIILNRLS